MLAAWVALVALASPAPLRLAADVDDAWAPTINPAGLGFAAGSELRVLVGRTFERDGTDLAIAAAFPMGRSMAIGGGLVWDGLGSAARFRPYLGASLGSERFKLGVSGLFGADGEPNALALGITVRPIEGLSIAATSLDVGANRGARPYDVALAARLFDQRLVASVRWRMLQGRRLEWDDGRLAISGLVTVEPLAGLLFAVESDLHFRPSFSVTVAFERLAISGFVRDLRVDDLRAGAMEIAMTSQTLPTSFRPTRIAVLDLAGDLAPDPRFSLSSFSFERGLDVGPVLLLDGIAAAPDLSGAFVRIGQLDVRWAKLAELRSGLLRIRARGRSVDCLLSSARDQELFVASACDRVALLAPIRVRLDGIAAGSLFFGEGLERLGVEPKVVQRGAYKSAPEQFTRSAMSPAQREVTNAILDQTIESLARGIMDGRHITRAELDAILALGTLSGEEAKARHLIDEVVFPDEIEGWLDHAGERKGQFVPATSLALPERSRYGVRPRIALIAIDDTITSGESRGMPFGLGGQTGADTIITALEAARRDDDVKAIVLRVDSPGGDAVASELIARKVAQVVKEKPVIASLGDVAASGGYYVAAPATAILAERDTLTGSIGIFTLGFSIERLLASVGVHAETIRRGLGPARDSVLSDWTPEEREITARELDGLYQRFLRTVEAGRKLRPEQLLPLAEGRVWTGTQAVDRGLVDGLGDLHAAIERARQGAGLSADTAHELVVLPESRAGLPAAARTMPGASGASVPGLPGASDAERALAGAVGALVRATSGASATAEAVALLPPNGRSALRTLARLLAASASGGAVAMWPEAPEVD